MGVPHRYEIKGKILTGAGKAADFTGLDWVRNQCREKLGFTPYPGTLNIHVDRDSTGNAARLLRASAVRLVPPDAGFCDAMAVPATVEGICAAVILPEETVRVHGGHIIEVLAPVSIRKTLGLADGDTVRLRVGFGAQG